VKIEDKKNRLYKKDKEKHLLFGDETQEERDKKNKEYKDNILIEKDVVINNKE